VAAWLVLSNENEGVEAYQSGYQAKSSDVLIQAKIEEMACERISEMTKACVTTVAL